MATAQSKSRVLVVDDEEAIRSFARRVLRDAGYEVTVASDGLEALTQVEKAGPFDLHAVDLVMPHMMGNDLARRLRARDPDTKVLYFTGFSDRLFEEKSTLWENEAFLEKPVAIDELLEAVSLLLFGHTRGPQAAGGTA